MNLGIFPIVGFLAVMTLCLVRAKLSVGLILWVYATVYTAVLAFWPYETMNVTGELFKYNIRSSHAQSLSYLLLIPLIDTVGFPRLMLWRGISWVFVLDAVAILFGFQGLLWGLSFDSAMIMLVLPMFYKPTRYHRVLTACALIAVYRVGGATSYLMAAAYILGAAVYYRNWLWLTILCPLFAIGHYSMGKALFVSQGRLDMWWAYIKWWAVSANHYVGAGLGSFEWISNMIYSDSHGYTFAHNDYLQVLFELGAIGFALFVVFIATEFYRLRNCGRYFITGCGLCAFMLTYSPLHVFPGMLVAILLCTGGPIGKKVV